MRRRLGWAAAAVGMVVAFLPRIWAPPAALGLAVAAALVIDRRVVRGVLEVGLLLAFVFAAAVTGALVAWSTDAASGLEVGLAMLLRLLVLAIMAALLARNVDADTLLRGAERLGLERLGLVLGLALNVLPRLAEATRQVGLAWRVRRRSTAVRSPSPLVLVEVLLAHVARVADEAAAAAALRGHGALIQRPMVAPEAVPLVVAAGATDIGKTAAVRDLVERLRSRGVRVVGIVQPGAFEDGRKVGFAVRDLATGEQAALARIAPERQGDHGTSYLFDAAGFALARRALGRVSPGDLVVVDELGPLELRGQGHMPAVRQALRVPGLAGALMVVRSQLVPALLAALPVGDAVVVEVTGPETADALLEALDRVCGGLPGRR